MRGPTRAIVLDGSAGSAAHGHVGQMRARVRPLLLSEVYISVVPGPGPMTRSTMTKEFWEEAKAGRHGRRHRAVQVSAGRTGLSCFGCRISMLLWFVSFVASATHLAGCIQGVSSVRFVSSICRRVLEVSARLSSLTERDQSRWIHITRCPLCEQAK